MILIYILSVTIILQQNYLINCGSFRPTRREIQTNKTIYMHTCVENGVCKEYTEENALAHIDCQILCDMSWKWAKSEADSDPLFTLPPDTNQQQNQTDEHMNSRMNAHHHGIEDSGDSHDSRQQRLKPSQNRRQYGRVPSLHYNTGVIKSEEQLLVEKSIRKHKKASDVKKSQIKDNKFSDSKLPQSSDSIPAINGSEIQNSPKKSDETEVDITDYPDDQAKPEVTASNQEQVASEGQQQPNQADSVAEPAKPEEEVKPQEIPAEPEKPDSPDSPESPDSVKVEDDRKASDLGSSTSGNSETNSGGAESIQAPTESDQSSSVSDQVSSESDQVSSESDQVSSESDQVSSESAEGSSESDQASSEADSSSAAYKPEDPEFAEKEP